MSAFASRLVAWQREHGRRDLPWQATREPYRIWLSEVMLQQTQVATVAPYYERFIARFPDLQSLASAPLDDVLALWSGLGYYLRARNLHRAARHIVDAHGGEFPRSHDDLLKLPGIGRSTAAAILAFTRGERRAILDGNVKRVLARVFAVRGYPGDRQVENELWQLAEALLPEQAIEAYTQGLMDLGARICKRTKPKCLLCPVAADCTAHAEGRAEAYPEPRPARHLPERETLMLLYFHRGSVLLEKRPPVGVWGGLWSLPEADVQANPETLCRDRFGVLPAQVRCLDPIHHVFTHFRLTIHLIAMWLAGSMLTAEEPGMMWTRSEDAGEAALPAPLKSLFALLHTLEPTADANAA